MGVMSIMRTASWRQSIEASSEFENFLLKDPAAPSQAIKFWDPSEKQNACGGCTIRDGSRRGLHSICRAFLGTSRHGSRVAQAYWPRGQTTRVPQIDCILNMA
jgi:hypothetical protein